MAIPELNPIDAARPAGLLHGSHRKHSNKYTKAGTTNTRSVSDFQSSICKAAPHTADTKNVIPRAMNLFPAIHPSCVTGSLYDFR
jgi:hypothetical protein